MEPLARTLRNKNNRAQTSEEVILMITRRKVVPTAEFEGNAMCKQTDPRRVAAEHEPMFLLKQFFVFPISFHVTAAVRIYMPIGSDKQRMRKTIKWKMQNSISLAMKPVWDPDYVGDMMWSLDSWRE